MNIRTRLRSEDECDQPSGTVKRHKKARYRPKDYTVGWVCALHIEAAAAIAMLDHVHGDLPRAPQDINTYTLGSIGHHNVVIASLPAGYYGTNNAATVASNIERSFPSIGIRLMVGIGGGAPGKLDLRLGDIVVGSRVMQYDLGKIVGGGRIERTGFSIMPPAKLLTYITKLRAIHEMTPTMVPSILQGMYKKYPHMVAYARPDAHDLLFHADFEHNPTAASCDECDRSQLVHRLERTNSNPKIHYEAIASGNQVIKHGLTRDKMAQELQVACFEMEAAGLMNFSYLIIRGICDYSDSHKNKQWQEYAAAAAAAYAKEFLSIIPTTTEASQAAMQDMECRVDEEPLKDWHQEFLKSLEFEQIKTHREDIKTAYTATCNWFLQSTEYLAWNNSTKLGEHHGFLWLSGKPGAGKSTIMKFAYTRARSARKTTEAVISFFFHARGDILERSTTGMYRSLLLQLLEKFPDLQKVCEDTDLVERNGTCPSLEATQILFRNAISMLGKHSLICFIDALDECDERQVQDMVRYFEALGQQAVEENIKLRICFSSRHYPRIFIRKGLRLTLEDQKGHGDDVQQYIRGNLQADPGPLLDEIEAQILQKAAGVFMWVVLVVDILNNEFSRGHVLEMRKRLAEIPDKLSGLFKNILTRGKINLKNLLLSLQWILFAKRPLTREEYYFAVFTGILDKDALTLEYITYSTSSDMMDRFVVSSSKGLAEVTKSKQPTVQFIHESVRDFLIKDHGFQELWPELGHDFENLSHDKLKQCCYDFSKLGAMLILSYGAFPKTNEDVKTLRAAVLKQAPFLQYATQHVLYHADIAASNICQDGFLAEFELGNWIIASNLFEDFSRRRYTEKASLFYVLAGKGCAALIQTRLRHDSKYYIKGEHYYYPVFAALINGHADAAQTLLKQAVSSTDGGDTSRHQDYMEFNLIFEDEYLFWDAATRGWAPVVEMFIERGADVNAIDSFKRSMLYWPVRMGHSNTVKLLIERGADVNYKHPGTFGLLQTALKYGKSAVVEILVANGADINVRDDSGETPLMHAIQKNITNLVLLLLEKGADIDCQDREGFTPLMIAIRDSKDKDIIRLLIENSADINIQSRTNQMTPLLCAIERGSDSDIIQLLIEGGADINVKDNTGKTALEKSFSMNHHEIAKILMENGADTSSVGFGGTTPEERWVATTSHNFASFNPRLPDNNDLDRNDDLAHTFEGMDCGE